MVENLITALIISITLQIIFFIFAQTFKTDKFTDLSYGTTFIAIALYFYLLKSSLSLIDTLLTFLVLIWGIRLASYLFIRILKTKKDARFDKIRGNFIKFALFWLFQAITVWIIMLPVVVALTSRISQHIGILTIVGSLIWLTGFLTEAIADQQKYLFKSDPKNKNSWISTGIWKYSRHPNYFGEMLCWWGIFIIVIPLLTNFLWLTIVGPIFITVILLFVSGIPPLEKRYNQKFTNNPNYQKYKNKTSLLIPLPPKN